MFTILMIEKCKIIREKYRWYFPLLIYSRLVIVRCREGSVLWRSKDIKSPQSRTIVIQINICCYSYFFPEEAQRVLRLSLDEFSLQKFYLLFGISKVKSAAVTAFRSSYRHPNDGRQVILSVIVRSLFNNIIFKPSH